MARKRLGANKRQKIAERRNTASKKKRSGVGKVLFTCLKAVLLVFGMITGGYWGVKKAMPHIGKLDFLKIENIKIYGNKHVLTTEILSLASIEKGIFMLDLKMNEIREKLLKIPWIEKVNIKRKIPNTVIITVCERKPIAFVNIGSVYMTDCTGYLWPLKPSTYWNLPVISGLKDTIISIPNRRLTPEGLARMHLFFAEVHKVSNMNPPGITQIDFSEKYLVRVRLEAIPAVVELNSGSIGEGMKNVCEILRTMEENTEKTPRHINLCYNNIAFVR